MPRQIKVNSLILLVSSLIFLTGCWDQQPMDQKAYVLGIGLDKTETDGIINVTYIISNPEAGSTQQGGGTEEPTHEIITFNAPSFIHSQNIANAIIAKVITYDILDFFVVSEEFAKDEGFIRWFYDATKDKDVRRDTRLIISKEKASDFIEKNKPKLETRRHEYFELMFKDAGGIGIIPDSTILDFFRVTEGDSDLFITAYATTDKDDNSSKYNMDSELIAGKLNVTGNTNPTQFLGSAIFKEGKMVGTLTVQETRVTELLNPTMPKPSFLASIPDPFMEEQFITARYTQQSQPKINVNVTGERMKIEGELSLLVKVLSNHSMVDYSKKKNQDKLKEHMTKRVEEHIAKLVTRTKEEFEGQPFGFSIPARRHFLTVQQWENYDWMKSYLDAEVDISVNITFGEFGRQSKTPNLNKVRD